jgi:hypothetical protein
MAAELQDAATIQYGESGHGNALLTSGCICHHRYNRVLIFNNLSEGLAFRPDRYNTAPLPRWRGTT